MTHFDIATDFLPCSELCPALTGESYGSIKYCPMVEYARHRKHSASANTVQDTRDVGPGGTHSYYDHPDYTDCCANFQCCINEIKNESKT